MRNSYHMKHTDHMTTRRAHNRTPLMLVGGILFLLLLTGAVFLLGHSAADLSDSGTLEVVQNEVDPDDQRAAVTDTQDAENGSQPEDEPLLPETSEERSTYIEVIDSCDHDYGGAVCLNVRSGPGTEYPVVERLRNDIVLKVEDAIEGEERGWYKVVFDEVLHYPERVEGDWYVAAPYVRVLTDEGTKTEWEDGAEETDRRIIVDRSEQMLYAYDGETLFLETEISTGVELSPTPAGTFTVFKKMPSRYMQGPLEGIPGSDYYDLPGVPWNLYFTEGGAVIHGAYWHENFGNRHSHGCVNLKPEVAKRLYDWTPLGTTVVVQE